MRTNIVIDDKLMRDTLRATGLKTKREAVELGLQTLLRLRRLMALELGGREIAIQAARKFRALRRLGVTIRKTIDTAIATRCIESGHVAAHSSCTSACA